MPQHCPAIPMTGTRSPRSFRRCKRSSATSSIAASPMPAIAATTPHPITSSRSTRAARSAASRRKLSASSNGVPPLSPSSAISRNITHGPQLPCPRQRRRHQRRARRRRLQLPPPPRMAEAFVAQNPDCVQPNHPAQIRLKSGSSRPTTCCRARLTGVPPREGQVRRRRATSRKPAKAQQKTKAKRGTASKPARNRHVTALRKDTKIARLARELAEGREQQAATSELLKVIGRSTLDLQPVFETLAENAVRLCEAKRSFIYRFDGQYLRVVATHNASPELRAFVEQNPIAPGRGSATARAALERRTVQVLDAQGDPEYTYGSRQADPFRTIITVPILKGNELFGAIGIYRHEVRAFTESQISLLETFADQAVIAIENVRLFDEVQARTRELSESLEQQTATSEVLQVVSSSPGELKPVFDAMLRNAVRICGARYGMLSLC